MDGNRRWAKKQGLPTLEGHQVGYDKLQNMLEWAKDAGVKNVIVYALSTENWNRSKEEVSYLMELFRMVLRDKISELEKEDVRIIFAGDLARFPDDIRGMMQDTMERTRERGPYTLVVAASYGGRAEIMHVTRELVREGKTEVTEEDFARHLWTAPVPDPDLIIRTGGEVRLSNFLPWQSVYSELFFTDTYWPDFTKQEFENILQAFSARHRRHGV